MGMKPNQSNLDKGLGKLKIVVIGGVRFQVINPSAVLSDNQLHGQTVFKAKEIRVSTEDSPEQVITTFIHEIIHVITKFYLPPDQDLTEDQVEQLGKGWFQMLVDSPQVLEFLSTSLKRIWKERES